MLYLSHYLFVALNSAAGYCSIHKSSERKEVKILKKYCSNQSVEWIQVNTIFRVWIFNKVWKPQFFFIFFLFALLKESTLQEI